MCFQQLAVLFQQCGLLLAQPLQKCCRFLVLFQQAELLGRGDFTLPMLDKRRAIQSQAAQRERSRGRNWIEQATGEKQQVKFPPLGSFVPRGQ